MTQKLGAEHAKKNYDPFLPKVVRKKIYMTQKLRHGSATQSGVGHFRVLRGSSGKILAPCGADFQDFRAQWEEFYIFRTLRGYFSEFSGPAGLCFSRLWTPQRHFLQIPIARSLKAPNCTIPKRSKDTHAKKNDPFHILGRNVQKHAKKNYDP